MQCYCNSGKDRNQCCGPLLAGQQEATTPEQLMRSRYSAYVCKNYDYVLRTYTASKRADLTVSALEESASGTTWLHLDVFKQIQAMWNLKRGMRRGGNPVCSMKLHCS